MKSIKIRFNLGRGKNYLKWKIQYVDGTIEYKSPTEFQLLMHGCTLKNHKKVAQKIFCGGEKVVCAWILCNSLEIKTRNFIQGDVSGERVRYNPRFTPHWMLNDLNVDGLIVDKLVTVDYGVYIV